MLMMKAKSWKMQNTGSEGGLLYRVVKWINMPTMALQTRAVC
jgi:hypothetical protein